MIWREKIFLGGYSDIPCQMGEDIRQEITEVCDKGGNDLPYVHVEGSGRRRTESTCSEEVMSPSAGADCQVPPRPHQGHQDAEDTVSLLLSQLDFL